MIITVTHPDSEEEQIPPFDLSNVQESDEDVIPERERLPPPTPSDILPLPPVMLGCATFGYGIYTDTNSVRSDMPVRVVRAALRAGMNAFDTSPHYHPSEIILGHALHALKDEFPRESYSIVTKAGKYGAKVYQHDYTPATIRKSVARSLKRLHTDYLDIVYLHDVEFVVTAPFPCPTGSHTEALTTEAEAYHLTPPIKSLGEGDDSVLDCLRTLAELKAEGKIRRIGIAGYSLPVLLRMCVLAKEEKLVDVVQTYAHQTIHCSNLGAYLPAFAEAGVAQVINAAPLSMGILTAGGGPEWHPAKKIPGLYGATREAVEIAKECGSTIEDVACAFGYRTLRQPDGKVVPVVIGCTDLKQVHQTLQVYADVQAGVEDEKRDKAEKKVLELFKTRGVHNVSWQSPAPDHFD